MSKRMAPADRKASILDAALTAAKKHGYNNFRLTHVAESMCPEHSDLIGWLRAGGAK